MNLEIKDTREEIWEKIQELIEKYEYYDQMSISSFHSEFFQKVEKYNKDYNRTIVFGKLQWTPSDINYRQLHQISLHSFSLTKEVVKKAHDEGKVVGVWFMPSEPDYYYDLFEMGVDVIITDYPKKVANQLQEYYSNNIYLEGCKSIDIIFNNIYGNISNCTSCQNGYELVKIHEQDRNLCKLKYELDPDLYTKDISGVYHQKNIFAIKMLMSPIEYHTICQKNGKTIFYFEWLFDLVGYDITEKNFLVSKDKVKFSSYSLLTQKHIKKLDFSKIEIYVDNKLINHEDFLCIDLYDTVYYVIYKVMGAHCYFIYRGEKKESYYVIFRLFDNNYLSFVTYDNKFLSNKNSWGQYYSAIFYPSSNSNSSCSIIKDPFQERISCIDKINDCMFCENENVCQKCNYGFSLYNEHCLPSTQFQNNVKYFTPDNGTNYYTCSSIISDCEECSYDAFSFNKFHCSKCSNGLKLSETYECVSDGINTIPKASYDPIVITSNFDQTIKAGDRIEFQIEQIQESKYYLNNNEIIFEDIKKTKALFFKYCQPYPPDGIITMIRCFVSSNIIRGEYSVISDGQNISIQPGKSITFTVDESEGGMFTQSLSRIYNKIEKAILYFVFTILYYDSKIKPGDLFPYKVYLLGNKRKFIRMRNLEEKYDYNISFPNCTAVSYSDEDNSAIGNISCYMPNYVPAGTYTKLQSDGFDVSPNSKLDIVFMEDYNASKFDNPEYIHKKRSSSSGSKLWIILLIIGIVLLIVITIVIIFCISKRKGNNKNNEESTNNDNTKRNFDNNTSSEYNTNQYNL